MLFYPRIRYLTALDAPGKTYRRHWHGATLLPEQRVLLSLYMIPMHQQVLDGGIGSSITSPRVATNWFKEQVRPVANRSRPGALQGRTDFGAAGFGGACPPKGDKPHRYIFTVFALKVEKLDVAADATAAMIGFTLNANKLATASFTAKYSR